jgi:small subunit ribosomal protein S8
MTDPIADLLSRIKTAQNARAEVLDVPHSNLKEQVVKIMVAEGYVAKQEIMKRMDKKFLRIALKYGQDKKGIITGLKRVSTPGRRSHAGVSQLPRVHAGFGTAIISTSKGVMTEETARSKKLGGEILCYIW